MCNVLDNVAKKLVQDTGADDTTDDSSSPWSSAKEIREACETITWRRICLASAYTDDILSENDYYKWRRHVWMIASFTAIIIGLDIAQA